MKNNGNIPEEYDMGENEMYFFYKDLGNSKC